MLWLAAAGAVLLLVPAPDPTAGLTSDLLPANTPSRLALAELATHFQDKSGLSQAVIVFERSDGPLTVADMEDANGVAARLVPPRGGSGSEPASPGGVVSRPTSGTGGTPYGVTTNGGTPYGVTTNETAGVFVRTPQSLASLGKLNPLLSADGKAALVVISMPWNYVTTPAVRMVNHVHAVLADTRLRPGLSAAVTGSAAYGRDHLLANERSHDKILFVTVAAVIVVLMGVYRAPVAAMIPLVAISLATAVATKLTILGHNVGLSSGTAERLFMLVLLYGAGVDYSLLFISRYREFLDASLPPAEAFVRGLDASLGAIVSSALATSAGLAMLCFARFGVFHDVGPAIVLALVVAAGASVTLVPAMVAIVGPRAFWPGWRGRPATAAPDAARTLAATDAHRASLEGASTCTAASLPWHPEAKPAPGWRDRVWPAVARFVTRRPGLVLAATLAALAIPVARGSSLTWSYDSQASLAPTYDAVRGMDMIFRHWSIGEIAPVTVVAVSDSPRTVSQWRSACNRMLERLRVLKGVSNVRSLSTPLGLEVDPAKNAAASLMDSWFGGNQVEAEFLSPDRLAMRVYVVLRTTPQTLEALDEAARVRTASEAGLAAAGVRAAVHLSGATADTADMRAVTQGDFVRTSCLSMAVILLIVVALLRDVLLSVFMVAATALSYVATLGLTYWAFRLIGQGGLDWEVEVFLFIVMVAVGQDYNIFFAVRLAQEGRRLGAVEAAEQAVIHTGRVISSCGLIMAATLGSMMAGDVKMLQQLGFALALGMLIDTFVVRPLMLPAFIVLTRRRLARAAAFLR